MSSTGSSWTPSSGWPLTLSAVAGVLTQAATVREEIRRPDFGHLEVRATVDDPKAYTKPWTVTLRQRIVVDAELIDEICLENEQFVKRMGLDGTAKEE